MDPRSGKNGSRIYSNGGIKEDRKDQSDGGESDEMEREAEKREGRLTTSTSRERDKKG